VKPIFRRLRAGFQPFLLLLGLLALAQGANAACASPAGATKMANNAKPCMTFA
jgi:hypothetical protein